MQVLGLVSIDIFILLLWTFVDRPRGITYESTAGGLYAPVQLTMCSTNLSSPFEQTMVAWKAMLLAAGVYKSICTWDMPSDIAEVSTHSTYSKYAQHIQYCALDYYGVPALQLRITDIFVGWKDVLGWATVLNEYTRSSSSTASYPSCYQLSLSHPPCRSLSLPLTVSLSLPPFHCFLFFFR